MSERSDAERKMAAFFDEHLAQFPPEEQERMVNAALAVSLVPGRVIGDLTEDVSEEEYRAEIARLNTELAEADMAGYERAHEQFREEFAGLDRTIADLRAELAEARSKGVERERYMENLVAAAKEACHAMLNDIGECPELEALDAALVGQKPAVED